MYNHRVKCHIAGHGMQTHTVRHKEADFKKARNDVRAVVADSYGVSTHDVKFADEAVRQKAAPVEGDAEQPGGKSEDRKKSDGKSKDSTAGGK